jgi:hypothetical protein
LIIIPNWSGGRLNGVLKFDFVTGFKCRLAQERAAGTSERVAEIALATARFNLTGLELLNVLLTLQHLFLTAGTVFAGLSWHDSVIFTTEFLCNSGVSPSLLHQFIFINQARLIFKTTPWILGGFILLFCKQLSILQ